MNRKIAILGCGPAGLFAAQAASHMGYEVDIFSKKRKSFMRGAQYLHKPIPELSNETDHFQIDYILEGSVEGYRKKIYGNQEDILVSPEILVGEHKAWDIREAYDKAWNIWEDSIQELDLFLPESYGILEDLIEDYYAVFSSVPAKLLCHQIEHKFESEIIWSTDFVKPIGIFERPMIDNVVVCSGVEEDWWYRQSRILGWENTEFPYNKKPEGKVWKVEKPISTDCDCFPEVQRMGRYGLWRKGVLSHESYYDTAEMLGELL